MIARRACYMLNVPEIRNPAKCRIFKFWPIVCNEHSMDSELWRQMFQQFLSNVVHCLMSFKALHAAFRNRCNDNRHLCAKKQLGSSSASTVIHLKKLSVSPCFPSPIT